jgi:hypothetical protein
MREPSIRLPLSSHRYPRLSVRLRTFFGLKGPSWLQHPSSGAIWDGVPPAGRLTVNQGFCPREGNGRRGRAFWGPPGIRYRDERTTVPSGMSRDHRPLTGDNRPALQ